MAKSRRTTITLPAELKAQMESVDEDVNWSAVASQAFKQKLAEIIQRKGVRDMKDVIARLKASKAELQTERYNLGFSAGQIWAKESADVAELERLESFRNDFQYGWNDWFQPNQNDAYGPCELLAFQIRPGDGTNRASAGAFWEEAIGEDLEKLRWDGEYLRGFAEGALDIWEEVKGQL